ncbi:Proton-coupled folate transporter, partial [Stegodyphus mimosarum]
MTGTGQISTISQRESISQYSYQGTIYDPPTPLHFENPKPPDPKLSLLQIVRSKLLKLGAQLKKRKLEFVAFLFTFSYVLTRISSTSMILDKVCLVHFEYPEFVCQNLENYSEIKSAIEVVATNYQLGHTLIQTVPATLLACFIGPWSDHYGRRFPVLLALTGMILDNFGSVFCAYYLNTRVEYYYIPAIFTGIFGGVVSLLAVVYSYASDTTPVERRTMKYAFIEISSGFALPLGALSGGWIYNFLGYPAVFFFSSGGMVLSFIWVSFMLDETRGIGNRDTWKIKLKNLFSCRTFKESFIATAKERPHQGRKQIVLLILSMCFIIITTNSTGDVNYLYVHHQFNWSNTEYSTITALYSVFAIILLFTVIPLLKFFKAGDATLGLLGTISLLIKYAGVGLAWKPVVYHIASICGLLGGCAPLAVRSRISKVVSNEDLGKVFSFVATTESLLPILATVFVSQMFNAFITTFPGMPYIMLAIFLIVPLSVFIWISCIPKVSYEDICQTEVTPKDTYNAIST